MGLFDFDLGKIGGYFQDRPELTQGLMTAGMGGLMGLPLENSFAAGGQAYGGAIDLNAEKQKLLFQKMLEMAKYNLDYSKYGLDVKKFETEQEFGPTQAAGQIYSTIKSTNQSVRPEYMNAVMRETLLAKQEKRQPQYRVEWFESVKPGARGLFQ
jgi:hypothetical protein